MKIKTIIILIAFFLFTSIGITKAVTVVWPQDGGTGTASIPTYGQMLVGNSAGTYTLTATSSLGISGAGGEANTGSSLGTGRNIFDTKSGVDLRFNTLSAGTNITLSTTSNNNTIVINSTGGSGGTGTVSTSTNETAGALSYWTSNSATPALLGKVATTTPTATAPITYSGTLGSFVGGIAGAFDCTSATGSVKGCLTSTDWTTFNGKQNTITAGDALTLTGTDIDFDGGTAPAGSLGGTWASPTIDDLFILNTGDIGTGSYTFPNASSTNFSTSYASSTQYYGASLADCDDPTNSKLLWSDTGKFSCGSDQTGAGGTVDGTGFAGMMTSWTDSNTIQSTSTVVGSHFIATSTTATSTFKGFQAGTDGLVYDSSSGDVWADAMSTFFVDSSANKVGFGTTTPPEVLTVGGTGTTRFAVFGGTSWMSFGADPTDGPFYMWNSTKDLRFAIGTNSAGSGFSEKFRMGANGNLGIGTSSPGTSLSIGNTGNSTINISPTATSTFGLGLNIRGGCFAINGVCITGTGGSGTVTSVDMSVPAGLTISGNPITTSGTLALGASLANNSIVGMNATGNGFVATGTPQLTVGNILATSTTATSTFPLLKATTAFQIGSDYITDITGTNLSVTNGVLSASGGGASADWVKENNFGALSLTASTTIPYWAKSDIYASSTLWVKSNKMSEHAAGFFDLQRTGADFTLMRIRAPKGDSQEATLSLVNDMSVTDAGVDEEFVDFYNENYGDSRQWGMRQAYSGTGAAKPFIVGHWNTAGSKDAGNKFIILPSGAVAVAQATSTVEQTAALHIASTTANYKLKVDDAPGTNLFSIIEGGKVGISTSSPADVLTVSVGNNAGVRVASTNSGFYDVGVNNADRWRMQNDFTNTGLLEFLYNTGAGNAPSVSLMTLTGTGSGIAGRVGIGTTSPNWKLSVAGNGSFDDYVRASYFTATSTSLYSTFPYADITTSLKIPRGTAPTINAQGQIALDTTSNNLILATSTTGHIVIGGATTSLYAFSVASTSPDFISGGVINLPAHFLPQVVTAIICDSDAGTSVAINLSNEAGTSDTNQITCTTTSSQFAITSNNTWNAYAPPRLEFGTVTGAVDYLIIRVIGYRTSD